MTVRAVQERLEERSPMKRQAWTDLEEAAHVIVRRDEQGEMLQPRQRRQQMIANLLANHVLVFKVNKTLRRIDGVQDRLSRGASARRGERIPAVCGVTRDTQMHRAI